MSKIILIIIIFLIFNSNYEYFTIPSKSQKLDSIICNRIKGTKIEEDVELKPKWCDYFSLLNKFQDRDFKKKNFKEEFIPFSKINNRCVKHGDCGQGYGTNHYFCDNGRCKFRNIKKNN